MAAVEGKTVRSIGRDPEKALAAARQFFEPRLERIKIFQVQVANQSLDELREILVTVNDAISRPEWFGTIKLTYTSNTILLVNAGASSHIEIGILPILLERRIKIKERICILELERDVDDIEERLTRDGADSAARDALIEELQKNREEERESLERGRQERELTIIEHGTREAQLQVEIQEKRAEIYQSWLARESIASLIGSVLLLFLGVAFIVAMFTHTLVAEVVADAFMCRLYRRQGCFYDARWTVCGAA